MGQNTLYGVPFHFYCAGVYTGRITIFDDRVLLAPVEMRQRTQLQDEALPAGAPYAMPFEALKATLPVYSRAEWSGERVVLENGAEYEAHTVYQATVDGVETRSQVWAFRGDTALDVVTVDGQVAAFLRPYRYGLEVLVKPGMEDLTPLRLYADPNLSQPRYGVNVLGTFLVPMRDGVKLATDVYLPEGVAAEAKLSTILVRTCYDRRRNQAAFMRWANRGYAVVNQDVRGRSDSEGELVPFYYERDDGSDTMDWIAAQSWSDGRVGVWGASYLGYVAVAAATSGNPHLKAVVDEVNVGSPFVDTVRRGGTVCSWPLLSWTLAQSVGNRTDFSIFAGETVDPDRVVDMRPIGAIPQQAIGRRSGPWDIWSQHPDYDDFWRECTFTERGAAVTAPMLVISGWYDGDSAGVSETWRMLSQHNVPNRKIWLGPWEHSPNRARDLMGVSFSNDAVVYHYDIEVLRWFDRFLKDMRNGIEEEPRARYYVVGENRWRASADWPPVESRRVPVYLRSGGRANSRLGDGRLVSAAFASQEPLPEAAYDEFLYNPEDPVSDSGERDPENLRQYELRNDMLVYTSDPLAKPLTVAGELSAEIYAASSATDTDWVVTLSDVDQAGNSLRLSSYIVRARYRKGVDQPALLTPGQVERYDIFLPNIGHCFLPQHRIRVSITSSSRMVAFPNTNTGLNPYDDSKPVVARQTIYHTAQYPSHIKLPVLSEV
ncbi:MAG: CocE/NonD family hydrolase [Firmicutes bacterium]|nr:CocE/NonD family hydrolase [Bacillota bacterium]